MAKQTSAAPKTQRRARGTGFPVMSLAEATQIIKKVSKYGFEHTQSAFASHLGHKTVNSGPYKQKLAALRDWNLVSGEGDRLVLTDLGKRIALPTSPAQDAKNLREAFRSCEIFASLYDTTSKGEELEENTLANTAVLNLSVAVASKTTFARSFIESAQAAGLAEELGDGKFTLLPDNENQSARETLVGHKTVQLPAAAAGVPSDAQVLMRHPWLVAGGELVFEVRLDRPLPPQAFGKLQEVASAIQDLAAVLGEPKKSTAESADEREN